MTRILVPGLWLLLSGCVSVQRIESDPRSRQEGILELAPSSVERINRSTQGHPVEICLTGGQRLQGTEFSVESDQASWSDVHGRTFVRPLSTIAWVQYRTMPPGTAAKIGALAGAAVGIAIVAAAASDPCSCPENDVNCQVECDDERGGTGAAALGAIGLTGAGGLVGYAVGSVQHRFEFNPVAAP